MRIIMDKAKKQRSLSVTLSINFLSLVLISLLVTGIIGTLFSFRAQQTFLFSQQQLIARNAANTVWDFINEKFIMMETTAGLINSTFSSRELQENMLNFLLSKHPAFRQLVVTFSKKQESIIVSRLSRHASGKIDELYGSDLFVQVDQGKRYISPVYVDKITNEPMVILSVPVKDVFRDIQGELIAEVNLKFMWDLMENLKIGKTGQAYVVDKQGKLIAFGDISRVLKGENAGNLKFVHAFISNPEFIEDAGVEISAGINGVVVLGTFAPLGMPDWAVVAELPLSEAYQTVIQLIILLILFTLAMVAVAGWIGILLARRLSVPIVKLMKTAILIANGERGLLAEISGPVEISNLADAFNSMTAQLREVIGRLDERRRYMEKTVQTYVEYMAEVGRGNMACRLELKEIAHKDDEDAQLIMLGRQLNETISILERMIQQIKEANEKIKSNEEKLLVYSDKLEKSNSELEQFAFVASHDLQEPLRKIQFFGDRLKTNYSGMLDEKARDYLDRLINSAVRMGKFIQDLLQYSRVTTKLKPFERVDLNEIVKGVLSDLELRINESKTEIKIDNLPVIDADPMQMKQLFQNIIGNAIKYRRENVPPVINVRSAISDGNNHAFYKIDISDNGIGFDNKYADQIFGLFQRLHGRSEYEGTGIGLAVCKKIVEQHGGTIHASGKVGEGSCFYITLPITCDTSK
jgi:signal transduction histidine kinase